MERGCKKLTFNEFVSSLFETPIGDFNTDFKNKIKNVSDKDVSDFWNSLLAYLKARPSLTPTTLLQEDFGENSFFDYIQSNSDINNSIEELSDYWNESIQAMVDYYNRYFNDELEEITNNTLEGTTITNGKIPLDNGNSFSTRDVKNADAAQAFGIVSSTIFTELVRPWYNVDWESYYKVRGRLDSKATKESDNLTFTREQKIEEFNNNLNRFIRLIMPNNSRRVAVEDLNRNFWVISSVIQAISAYLFGSTAPIPYMFKNILGELMQLWDNVMYLWAAFGIISQKEASDMRVIILPLPKSEYITYQKYDNSTISFPEDLQDQKEYVIKRIKFLIQRYSHSNLCILPYTKQTNYYYNHYASETYRCIVFYNAKTKKISYVPLVASVNGQAEYSVYFNPENFKNYLYAIRETDTYYSWSFPIGNINNILDR